MDKLEKMKVFGEASGTIDFSSIHSFDDLPEAMQITTENVKKDASIASFICYCYKNNVPMDVIIGRCGLSSDDVTKVVKEAKEIEIFDELSDDFLISGEDGEL